MKERLALLRNMAVVAMAGYLEAAVGLLAGVLIARTLGPTGYGQYAFAVWLCGLLLMAGNHALPATAIKFLAESRGAGRPEVTAALAHRFLRLQTLSSSLVLLLFVAGALLFPPAEWQAHLPWMVAATVLAVWSRGGFWMRAALGKGHELFVPENLALALTALLNAAVTLVLAWQAVPVTHFFLAYALLGLASNLFIRGLLRRHALAVQAGPLPGEVSDRLRRHLWLTGVLMLLTLCTNRAVEMFLLKRHAGLEAVGYFAIAGALTKGAVDLIAGGLASVLLPAMARRHGQGGVRALGGVLAESARVYAFLGLTIAGLGLVAGVGLVHLLYGARYDAAIPALLWHLGVAGFTVMNSAAAATLTASDHQADRIRIILAVLATNVVAGLVLIPRYGLDGAIASYALTHAMDTLLCWGFARRRTQVKLPWACLARQVLAALIGFGLARALWALWPTPWASLPAAAGGLLLFLALSVFLRTWKAADIEIIAHLVSRLGRPGRRLAPRVLGLKRFALHDTV